MLEGAARTFGDAVATLVSIGGLVVFIGVSAHALTWLLMRRPAAEWVWGYWNILGSALLLSGLAAIGYAWFALGLQSIGGSALAGFGLLLASAGLWMIVPI
jgi:hypothetical protein